MQFLTGLPCNNLPINNNCSDHASPFKVHAVQVLSLQTGLILEHGKPNLASNSCPASAGDVRLPHTDQAMAYIIVLPCTSVRWT